MNFISKHYRLDIVLFTSISGLTVSAITYFLTHANFGSGEAIALTAMDYINLIIKLVTAFIISFLVGSEFVRRYNYPPSGVCFVITQLFFGPYLAIYDTITFEIMAAISVQANQLFGISFFYCLISIPGIIVGGTIYKLFSNLLQGFARRHKAKSPMETTL